MTVEFSSHELSEKLSAELLGQDFLFQFVSSDTRTLRPGDLFIALKGPNYDGHNFIADAEMKGAIGALIQSPVKTNLPLLKVQDTYLALAKLANLRRKQMAIPIVGITGSCGKTTTKAMVANILRQKAITYASPGTFNNNIGVPLSLLQLVSEHCYAVIEMGANHFGEIAYLTQIVQPNVAIITNAAPVHLEGFGDVAGVARAKGEIFQGLLSHGKGIINADDAYFSYWQKTLTQDSYLSFGLQATADITAQDLSLDEQGQAQFLLKTKIGEIPIHLPILGEHNILNALAAAAAALALEIDLPTIKLGLETMQAVDKRLIRYAGVNGCLVIDDSYNANPMAFSAALQVLKRYPGRKILALGDMGELGPKAEDYHIQLGLEAKQMGVDDLLAIGELSRFTVAAFGNRGQHFLNHSQLLAALLLLLQQNSTVLVKGSKRASMEQVVQAIKDKQV